MKETLPIGTLFIVRGHAAHALASNEDPAIVNSSKAFEGDSTKEPSPEFYVNATMLPEGLTTRNVVGVPLFGSAADAKAYRAIHPEVPSKPGNQDANLLGYPMGDEWPPDPPPVVAEVEDEDEPKRKHRKKDDA